MEHCADGLVLGAAMSRRCGRGSKRNTKIDLILVGGVS